MKKEIKNNNNHSLNQMALSLFKNKNNEMNSFNQFFNKNISSKIKFLTTKNEKIENKNSDIIFLNKHIPPNVNTINQINNESNLRRQSIGINTSNHYENKRRKKKSIDYIKPKIFNTKPYSALFKKYFISYDDINKVKAKPLNETKIPKLKPKKKFNTISATQSKRIKKSKENKIIPIKNKDKESLFTYNFVKDAYSEEERLLLNISNNNLDTLDKVKFYNRLKKAKSKKNFKTFIYSIDDLKSMKNKDKNNKKFKLFNMTNFFHENPKINAEINHSITKDIKNSFCNSLLKDIFAKEDNKKLAEEKKLIKREEILKLMEYPDGVFNYILQQLKEYNSYHNKRNGFKMKLENMKSDLKLTEQKALYQLINLKYDRVPGDEINIRTNLFCIKNKNNLNL